jgi:hypothetical protein
VLGDQGLEQVVLVGSQGAAVAEDLAQREGTIVHPATEGVEEGVAVDEVVLEGQQPEQEVAVGGAGHGGFESESVAGAAPAVHDRGCPSDHRR